MRQMLNNKLKEQKGLTLIELLAVIVILGIIAAIAIPSVLGLIDNSKKDAHIANANQMIASAKLAVANNSSLQSNTKVLTYEYLVTNKFIEVIKDPDSNSPYVAVADNATPVATPADVAADFVPATTVKAYVIVSNGKVTKVRLAGSTRGVQGDAGAPVTLSTADLSRTTDVKANPTAN